MAFSKTFNLAMKLGVKFALVDGIKKSISNAPHKSEGEVWLPIDCCEFDFAVKKSFDGVTYGALSSVIGMYTKFDDMGLVIVDSDESVEKINRKDNLYDMTSLMSSFIYEIEAVNISMNYAPATDEEIKGFKRVAREAMKLGTGKKHPVIFADNDKFEKIKAVYEGDDSPLKSYIQKAVNNAEKLISEGRSKLNSDESGLESPFVCQYDNPEQYDIGGRMGESSYTSYMRDLAFAYRVTGKVSYAKCAYYLGVDLGKWNHWGPCHFLNCATAMKSYAVAYDWLYDAWGELGFDRSVIRSGLIKNGIIPAYRSIIDDDCDFRTANPNSTGWRFKLKKDNWNAVCNSGVLTGIIALLADDEPFTDSEYDMITSTLGGALVTLMCDGQVLRQYAPDGSYVESNTYWSYGTNALLFGVGALYSYFGTDFGITKSPGMDKTCYYALNSESAEYVGWSYHDGDTVSQDTSMFNLFATVSGDNMLYAIRRLHLSRGKESSLFDILYNPEILGKEVPTLDSFPLDYYMEGIDAIVIRDGWERGSLYTGIMGGPNPQKGSHNHIDSGAFVYHNKGKLWITDLGKDYYNIKGGYFGNNRLYRRNAEGHNVVFIKELESGQSYLSCGKITRVSFEDEKSLAVIDNREVYGKYAKAALRGMLVTNGRKTTVVQDEIEFLEPCEAFAAYHYKSSEIKAEILDNGTECILTHNDGTKIFLKLMTENEGARFEITDCYTYLLDNTADFEGEYSREDYSRLLVKYGKTKQIRSAFVITEEKYDTGYAKITPMEKW